MPGPDRTTVRSGHLDPVGPRLDRGHLGAGLDRRPGGHRRLGQHVDDLAEAAARVEEHLSLPRAVPADQLAGDTPDAAGADPAASLLGVDVPAGQPPQLLRVRPVERVVELRSERADQQRGVRGRVGTGERPGGGVPADPQHRPRRQRAGQLGRAERETDPAVVDLQPPVARPGLQVVAEQLAQQAQHRRRGGRVQPVAAGVDPDAGHLERGRHPADRRRPLQQQHRPPGPSRPPGRREPGRPAAQHHHVDVSHPAEPRAVGSRPGEREGIGVGEFVRFEVDGGIGTIRLDRPPMNALNAAGAR